MDQRLVVRIKLHVGDLLQQKVEFCIHLVLFPVNWPLRRGYFGPLRRVLMAFFELFFGKKIPLSRRVGYVMGGSVSGSVRDVCYTNQIGSTIKHQSNFLL